MALRLRGRPAHTPGPTFLAYTPDGTKLISVGLNNAIRIFHTGSDAEPTTIDDCADSNAAVAATNDFFVVGSEDGTVTKYSLHANKLDGMLTRCTLPIRDIAISPDGNWAAVASDELVVKVVNTEDMTRILYLREQPKPAKHLTFDKSGSTLAVSCSDGVIYMYSLSLEEPKLLKKLDGLIKSLETEAEASSKVFWHPDGRAFLVPTATRDLQVVSRIDWEKQRIFKDGHTSDISAAAWSPNGSILVTASIDRKLLLWDAKDQRVFKSYDDVRATILAMQWHPTKNILSYTNNDGELYIHTDFVPEDHDHLLKKSLQPAPFIHDPLEEANGHIRPPVTNAVSAHRTRDRTPDSLDEISDLDRENDFIEDDDGAGYAEHINGHGKRPYDASDDEAHYRPSKRHHYSRWQPKIHEPFQPGSTPWRGNRKYLCLNLTGVVWTVSQETHHTVTVEFYDREQHRDFHFTDPWLYDKACLNENGTFFSCPCRGKELALLYYRPHETWTARADWRIPLPKGEDASAIALSENYIVCLTSSNYVRIYSLYGVPVSVHRQKSAPAVTCAAWRDYVLTVGNGPVAADGRTQLLYSITNVKRSETCQNEDILALPPAVNLQSVFFSDAGDPCVYDSSGTLLICLHWRSPGQAKWVPLLDTTQLERLRDGKKEESYWPVAVARERFHCIILKGGEKYPYFPRPLLSEFDFKIPISSSEEDGEKDADGDDTMNGAGSETKTLEQQFILNSTLQALLEDLVSHTRASHTQKLELQKRDNEIDKTLLQLLAMECREGEERGMKGLEIVGLMRDRSGRMLEAAMKVASRYGREVLRERIERVAERRVVGLEGEDDE